VSLTFIEQLELDVNNGEVYYACPGSGVNEWFISKELDKCKQRAQRTANGQKFEASIYRLINHQDVAQGDVFLVVRKILDPGARGEATIRWMLVDTRDGAELVRDVSMGVTPYFGAVVEEKVFPEMTEDSKRKSSPSSKWRR